MTRPKLTVWYNTKCPVCSPGIDWQRSRLVRAARVGTIEFRDINLQPDALASLGANVEDQDGSNNAHHVDASADGALPSILCIFEADR